MPANAGKDEHQRNSIKMNKAMEEKKENTRLTAPENQKSEKECVKPEDGNAHTDDKTSV